MHSQLPPSLGYFCCECWWLIIWCCFGIIILANFVYCGNDAWRTVNSVVDWLTVTCWVDRRLTSLQEDMKWRHAGCSSIIVLFVMVFIHVMAYFVFRAYQYLWLWPFDRQTDRAHKGQDRYRQICRVAYIALETVVVWTYLLNDSRKITSC